MSTKIAVKVTVKDRVLCINGIDLRVYSDGTILRYVQKSGQHGKAYYAAGWNLTRQCLDNGYMKIALGGRNYRVSRIVYYAFNPSWDIHDISRDNQIDHIDHDRTNNNLYNLRLVTNAQNMQNSEKPKNNTSGYKGFIYKYRANRQSWYWHFEVDVNKRRYEKEKRIPTRLGKQDKELVKEQFPIPQQFIDECQAFRETLHGEFASH